MNAFTCPLVLLAADAAEVGRPGVRNVKEAALVELLANIDDVSDTVLGRFPFSTKNTLSVSAIGFSKDHKCWEIILEGSPTKNDVDSGRFLVVLCESAHAARENGYISEEEFDKYVNAMEADQPIYGQEELRRCDNSPSIFPCREKRGYFDAKKFWFHCEDSDDLTVDMPGYINSMTISDMQSYLMNEALNTIVVYFGDRYVALSNVLRYEGVAIRPAFPMTPNDWIHLAWDYSARVYSHFNPFEMQQAMCSVYDQLYNGALVTAVNRAVMRYRGEMNNAILMQATDDIVNGYARMHCIEVLDHDDRGTVDYRKILTGYPMKFNSRYFGFVEIIIQDDCESETAWSTTDYIPADSDNLKYSSVVPLGRMTGLIEEQQLRQLCHLLIRHALS